MNDNRFSERLTPDNAVIAMLDHQTGLLINCRDQDSTVVKTNILGLCNMAKVLDLPAVEPRAFLKARMGQSCRK